MIFISRDPADAKVIFNFEVGTKLLVRAAQQIISAIFVTDCSLGAELSGDGTNHFYTISKPITDRGAYHNFSCVTIH